MAQPGPLASETCSPTQTRKEDEAVGRNFKETDGERERFSALLDLYEKALQDLRTFALKRSLNKDMDDEELCSQLEAKVASPAFLDILGSMHVTSAKGLLENQDDRGSWELISEADLINCDLEDSQNSLKPESFVVINQEDIVEGMACFMAKYVSTLPQAKDLSPKQLQSALKKVLGAPKKGRLRKLWRGSKFLYTAASWGATAVSLYHNPLVVQAASKAFWTSIQLVTKYM